MGQVQGLIPGMRREEEVPDPVPQEEYQEYQIQFLSLLVSLSISLSRDGRKSGGT